MYVWLEAERALKAPGWVYFGSNYFILLPNEGRAVPVEWAGVPAAERRLKVGAWNTPAYHLRADG
jgi:hypothetical protein